MVACRSNKKGRWQCFQLDLADGVVCAVAQVLEEGSGITRFVGRNSSGAQVLESAASTDTSNAPFTDEEKAYIVEGINEIKQYLLTAHKLDPELVESRLNYLIESWERVGRKDWINLLISVLVGIVISAALPPEATRELFRFV